MPAVDAPDSSPDNRMAMPVTEAMREEASRLLADPRISARAIEDTNLGEEMGWIAEQFDLGRRSTGPPWEEVFASPPGAMDANVNQTVSLTAELIETRARVAELTSQRFGCYRLAAVMREIILADCQLFYGADSRQAHRAQKGLLAARSIIP